MRSAEPSAAPLQPAAPPDEPAALVLVVGAPRPVDVHAASPGARGLAPRSRVSVGAGLSGGKTVDATAGLVFPAAASGPSDLELEALASVARLAARERCDLLVWARAGDERLTPEARRRAEDIRARALAAAPLDASRVTTLVTTGFGGVDVLVSALRAGAALDETIPAATALVFPSEASEPSDVDSRALSHVARLAARQRSDLLVWARANEERLAPQARERAADVRARALAAAPLDASRVTTRVTTHAGGVDAVVLALRDASWAAGARELRDAVRAAQPSIEACVREALGTRRAARASGVLSVSVAPTGRVTRVAPGTGDVSGPGLEACLTAASTAWRFPTASDEYGVDVPISVVRGVTR